MFASAPQIHRRRTNPFNNQTSTSDTIEQMNKIVAQSMDNPVVMAATTDATYACYMNDERQVADAIWYWIKRHVKFVTDETLMARMGIPIENPTKELLVSPPVILSMPEPMGDCDCFSMLAKTMLLLAGLRVSFVTVKADREDPRIWSHIYCRVYFADGTSMPFDASHGEWPGWETKRYWEKREWA